MLKFVANVEPAVVRTNFRMHIEGNIGSGKSTLIRGLLNSGNDKIKSLRNPSRFGKMLKGLTF